MYSTLRVDHVAVLVDWHSERGSMLLFMNVQGFRQRGGEGRGGGREALGSHPRSLQNKIIMLPYTMYMYVKKVEIHCDLEHQCLVLPESNPSVASPDKKQCRPRSRRQHARLLPRHAPLMFAVLLRRKCVQHRDARAHNYTCMYM